MSIRKGATLTEILVTISVVATGIALTLPAIMAVREAAMRAKCANQQRQFVLAIHNFSTAHGGRLPSVDGNLHSANYPGASLFGAIFPYVEGSDRRFVSPADPTLDANWRGSSSYAANAQLFIGNPSLEWSVPDGTSYTIALAEHYSHCQQMVFGWGDVQSCGVRRRATFADAECGDVVPVTQQGQPPHSLPSWPAQTFQVAPSVFPEPGRQVCWFAVAQTPHRSGMLTAFADGSCRVLAPDIDPFVYWGAVTPARGEIPGDF